jgi:hypothetical protein
MNQRLEIFLGWHILEPQTSFMFISSGMGEIEISSNYVNLNLTEWGENPFHLNFIPFQQDYFV